MPSRDLCSASLREVSDLIHQRSISAAEVAEAVTQRVLALDSRLHSLITFDEAGLSRAARKADEALRRGDDSGPLHGIPITVKDQFATRGLRTTLGSKLFADHVPDYDAAVVERARAAGAIVAGKANMYELATGWGTYGFFPLALNPWSAEHSPGGSSSGSAVGVAAGLAYASLASDGGGSTRVPSNYCGVVGLKPTHGRVSFHGSLPEGPLVHGRQIPISKSISVAGVITRRVEDAAIMLEAIAGWDGRDPASEDIRMQGVRTGLTGDLANLVVGVPWDGIQGNLDEESRAVFDAALGVLRDAGATVAEVAAPESLEQIAWMWTTIAYVEMAVSFRDLFDSRPDDFGPELQARLRAGRSTTAEEYFLATQARAKLRSEWLQLLKTCDVVATPTAPAAPPTMRELVDRRSDLQDIGELARYTRPYNMTGLPAVSIPSGFSRSGLPLGLQIGGGPFEEGLVLRVAEAFERRTPWHTRRPPLEPSASEAGEAITVLPSSTD